MAKLLRILFVLLVVMTVAGSRVDGSAGPYISRIFGEDSVGTTRFPVPGSGSQSNDNDDSEDNDDEKMKATPPGKTIFKMNGLRFDNKMQHCTKQLFKRTFPDVDYALLGYDILKGYPLAMGSDPGFTHPIFQADYSGERQSADCHFSIPKGYTIIPDVSCVTSFSSSIVKTSEELSDSLRVNAHVEGGGWGVSFSASAAYQKASKALRSGEEVYIISKASCDYYFASLNTMHLPPFDEDFIEGAKKIAEEGGNEQELLKFIDYYGTHYSTRMNFGARFMYIHTMKKSTFNTMTSSNMDVSASASYSGLFSLGGGFGMSSAQRQAASTFSSNTKTQTVTVGAAPPSNGDAMTWASTVKESPVPSKYNLDTIDKLFTKQHMGHLGFDYTKVKRRLHYFITGGGLTYRTMLKNGAVIMDRTFIESQQSVKMFASHTICIQECLNKTRCQAISFCDRHAEGCHPLATSGNCILHMTGNFQFVNRIQVRGWKLMTTTMHTESPGRTNLVINRGWLLDWNNLEMMASSGSVSNYFQCLRICNKDDQCRIVNYCDKRMAGCSGMTNQINCRLFRLDALTKSKGLDYFVAGKTVIFESV